MNSQSVLDWVEYKCCISNIKEDDPNVNKPQLFQWCLVYCHYYRSLVLSPSVEKDDQEFSYEYENAMFNNELLQSMERSTDLTETHSSRITTSSTEHAEDVRDQVWHVLDWGRTARSIVWRWISEILGPTSWHQLINLIVYQWFHHSGIGFRDLAVDCKKAHFMYLMNPYDAIFSNNPFLCFARLPYRPSMVSFVLMSQTEDGHRLILFEHGLFSRSCHFFHFCKCTRLLSFNDNSKITLISCNWELSFLLSWGNNIGL